MSRLHGAGPGKRLRSEKEDEDDNDGLLILKPDLHDDDVPQVMNCLKIDNLNFKTRLDMASLSQLRELQKVLINRK